ncbi:MAG: Slp family lipoprotein [Nitrospira sp. BO4]|jgi:starvation-inducible outer membrane lipoprotein|nr:Slp family lipoprotein [Nitrospira sp. BO4]
MFPAAMTEDIESSTFNDKAWVDEAYHSSNLGFVPHKVKLGGKILQVIRNQEGMVILAEKRPIIKADPAANPTSVEEDDAPWFAITFQGAVEPSMLQTGNRLIAVGTTNRASAELFGGAPRMLPHLMAKCLHIWNDEGVMGMYVCTGDASSAGRMHPDEGTFCLEETRAGSLSSDSDGHKNAASGGS